MGRGVAKILAQKGANIVIVARNQDRLAEALAVVSVCCLMITFSLSKQQSTD